MSHLYIGIEAVSMTAAMKQTLVQALQRLGPARHAQPSHLCHWRIRPDGDAAIFEAAFDGETVTPMAIRNRLAALYGVEPSTVTFTTAQTAFGPVVTFKTGATVRLRLIAFGGVDASWSESQAAVLAYLAANAAAWGEE